MGKDLTNAKVEFQTHVVDIRGVLCARIVHGEDEFGNDLVFILETGYTSDDYNEFLNKLSNINYDSGYGCQNLFGIIWYKNGNFSQRGEYDGSEWWEYIECPTIPDDVRRLDKERDEKLNQIL
jgi:hypothetical protein